MESGGSWCYRGLWLVPDGTSQASQPHINPPNLESQTLRGSVPFTLTYLPSSKHLSVLCGMYLYTSILAGNSNRPTLSRRTTFWNWIRLADLQIWDYSILKGSVSESEFFFVLFSSPPTFLWTAEQGINKKPSIPKHLLLFLSGFVSFPLAFGFPKLNFGISNTRNIWWLLAPFTFPFQNYFKKYSGKKHPVATD